MIKVNISKAKTELSKLISMLENNIEDRIVISRGKTPVAVLIPYTQPQRLKLGLFKGKYVIPDNIDDCSDEVLNLFANDES